MKKEKEAVIERARTKWSVFALILNYGYTWKQQVLGLPTLQSSAILQRSRRCIVVSI